jgi:glycosyltransferase involved in cell wall biosynthesis
MKPFNESSDLRPETGIGWKARQDKIGVLQLTDTLVPGGMERMAVNLANALPADAYQSHLCFTRKGGALEALIASHVNTLNLRRKGRFDVGAVIRLVKYIREHQIQIIHAHGTTLIIAVLAAFFRPHPVVLWHNHGGWLASLKRAPLALRLFVMRSAGIIVVNEELLDWSVSRFRLPGARVWYVPNFVVPAGSGECGDDLPGKRGSRVVSVANLLPPKDPVNLLRAMKIVASVSPDAHLLLVGRNGSPEYMKSVEVEMADPLLDGRVTFFGVSNDVEGILAACDIGVLASASEGFPLALVEYGCAGLAVAATRVGQCADLLDQGRAGILVPPSSPGELAEAILVLLRDSTRRESLGRRFQDHVNQKYNPEKAMAKVTKIYNTILSDPGETLQ